MLDLVATLRQLYQFAEQHSDDPQTKIAALLVNPQNQIIGQGANCLPQGVHAHAERLQRPGKYNYLIHAEQNAIANAAFNGHATANSTMYCPWAACTACARLIIQAGVRKVIVHKDLLSKGHWQAEIDMSLKMFQEAGIEYYAYAGAIGGVSHTFNGEIWQP